MAAKRKGVLPELAGVSELVAAVIALDGPKELRYASNMGKRLARPDAPQSQLVANGRWRVVVKADALAWLLTREPPRAERPLPRLAGRYEVAVATSRDIDGMTALIRSAVEAGQLEGQHLKAGWVVPYDEAVALFWDRRKPGAKPQPPRKVPAVFRRALLAAVASGDAPRRALLLQAGRDKHGLSLRDLGAIIGLSHEAVAKILDQAAAGPAPRVNRPRMPV
jgi:hypothetical protein